MKIEINDLQDLRLYKKLSFQSKVVVFVFDKVVFNCVVPSKYLFDYTFGVGDMKFYKFRIRAKEITFNYLADVEELSAYKLIAKDAVSCEWINVTDSIEGKEIKCSVLVGNTIECKNIIVDKIICNRLQAKRLKIGDQAFHYVSCDGVSNIGGKL